MNADTNFNSLLSYMKPSGPTFYTYHSLNREGIPSLTKAGLEAASRIYASTALNLFSGSTATS